MEHLNKVTIKITNIMAQLTSKDNLLWVKLQLTLIKINNTNFLFMRFSYKLLYKNENYVNRKKDLKNNMKIKT